MPYLPHENRVLCSIPEVRERFRLVLQVLHNCCVVGEVVQICEVLPFSVAAPQIINRGVEGRHLLDICTKMLSGQPGTQIQQGRGTGPYDTSHSPATGGAARSFMLRSFSITREKSRSRTVCLIS